MQAVSNSRIVACDPAFDALPACIRHASPDCGLILGSGWSENLPAIELLADVPYAQIPGLGSGTVPGHANRLRLFRNGELTGLAFCGRRHWYECTDWSPVILPVELLRRLGVGLLLTTNAAGAIRTGLAAGDLMQLSDHLNVSGINPFQGSHRPPWSPRFPDLSAVYDAALGRDIRQEADRLGLSLNRGVYAFTTGPCYETPAEVRALAAMGADAVGMSTVPECMLAHAAGMRVAAVSCMTNLAAGILDHPLTHAQVLAQTQCSAPDMARLVQAFLNACTGHGSTREPTAMS